MSKLSTPFPNGTGIYSDLCDEFKARKCFSKILVKSSVDSCDIYYTLNGFNLLSFHKITSKRISSRLIYGLGPGQTPIALAFRPENGALYLLANSPGGAHLYILNINDECYVSAVSVGDFLTVGGQPIVLDGTVSVTFEEGNILHVVTNNNQNLLVDPDTGYALSLLYFIYGPEDPNAGSKVFVEGISALNQTTYIIDAGTKSLAKATGPTILLETVGPLGINFTKVIGFDIVDSEHAYAIIEVDNQIAIYSINLQTGTATKIQNLCYNQLSGFAIFTPIPSFINYVIFVDNRSAAGQIAVNPGEITCQTLDIGGEKCDHITLLIRGRRGYYPCSRLRLILE